MYPYKRIPEKISQSFPPEWGIARSDRGWMTCEVFYEYIANIFHPFFVSQGVIFPVMLFVDDHKSHLSNDTFKAFVFITFCFKSYVSVIYNSASKINFRNLKFYVQ